MGAFPLLKDGKEAVFAAAGPAGRCG